MSDPAPPTNPDRRDETQPFLSAEAIVQVLDEYLDALKAGQAPSRAELLARHPEMAAQLEACLAGLDFVHQAQTGTRPDQRIGDFQLVREVGRGGMGAVFEAIQSSLGRRVALKILRFGPTSDPDSVERFRREAETVAALHHTNIVPIFYVGSEKGVNYYAMQFIEGRDLAAVIADRQSAIRPRDAAAWGLQAAEALAHAHRRGVIHRDVKPSNLILDNEDRLWLTDFGLARRLDDVTLSLTGLLLGTPRYMSPEHARASTKRIDHRSDIFSLGATLYELLTRTPAFPGEAAHDVIQQILVDEPTPIRKLNPAVPRDLETVVMKCMAKEPSARYASADALAADLRAVLDDRPIRARRATTIELAGRWLKQNQRSVTQISTAAIVTLLLTLAIVFSRSGYISWNMSGVRLDALNPPLVAEIVDQQGTTVRTETLPMQEVAHLPAGDYDVRVSADGTLSQTFELRLDRGRSDAKFTVNVADTWLVPRQPLEHSYDVFDTGREQAIAVWGREGLTVHSQHGPPATWSLALSPATTAALKAHPAFTPPRSPTDVEERTFGQTNQSRPWIIHEHMDVNGDGVGDIVCAARHQAWMMAISGTGDDVLWFTARGREFAETSGGAPPAIGDRTTHGSVLYPPLVCGDIDEDGMRDFIVSLVDLDVKFAGGRSASAGERWLEAISSRTGQSLWRYDLTEELFVLGAEQAVPPEFRWFHPNFRGRMSQGGSTISLGQRLLRTPSKLEQTGSHLVIPGAHQFLPGGDPTDIALVAGKRLLLLDADSGELRRPPIELPFVPGKAVQWADVDGDSTADMITLEEQPDVTGSLIQPKLWVWSVARGEPLWSKQLDAYWPGQRSWSTAAPDWPLVTDLNDDGKSEVIVPDGRSHPPSAAAGGNPSRQMPAGNLVVYDGASGKVQWTRSIVTLDAEVDYFVDGSDIDGDGAREVFAATCDPQGQSLFVDALSGASGKTLWSKGRPIAGESTFNHFQIVDVRWWDSGADGWPQLVVRTLEPRRVEGVLKTEVLTFSAGTGRLVSTGHDIADLLPIDLDQDGAEDLIVCDDEMQSPGIQGSLHAIRGVIRQPWKRLAALDRPTSDLNRDGVRDFIRSWGDGTLVACSGASGRKLWRSRAVRSVAPLGIYPADRADGVVPAAAETSSGDLDGDGTDDLLVFDTHISGRRKSPLHAISGRSGSLLWSLDDVDIQSIGGALATKVVDLDGNGEPQVLWLAAVDYRYSVPSRFFSITDVQLWLFAAEGKTGRLQWAQPLSPAYGPFNGKGPPPIHFDISAIELVTADFDGDGRLDVLVPALQKDDSLELRALSGRDGSLLWRRPRQADGLGRQALENWTSPVVADFQGDGRAEIVLVEPFVADPTPSIPKVEVAVTALDATGRELWTRPTGSVFTHFSSYSRRKGELLKPVLIHAAEPTKGAPKTQVGAGEATGKRCERVVVVLPGSSTIASFDHQGRSVERRLDFSPDLTQALALDIDGDGGEELFFVDRGTVFATAADDLEHVHWQRTLGPTAQQQIMEVREATDVFPPLVVIRTDGAHNAVMGMDARNGSSVWSCPGPIPRGSDAGVHLLYSNASLLGGPADQPPLVCFRYDFVNDCRQGFRTQPTEPTGANVDSSKRWAQWSARGTDRLAATVAGVSSDPRWKRPLPWYIDPAKEPGMLGFCAWVVFFALTMIVIPVGYVGWLVAQRRFQLSHWLMLPVVAAIFLQAVIISAPEDRDFATLAGRLSIAFAFSPPLLAFLLLVRWMIQKRWRLAGMWLLVLLLGSATLALISLVTSMRFAPLIEHESFDWHGWYLILLPGGYLTSWIMTVVVPLAALFNWLQLRWRLRRKTGQVHLTDNPVHDGI